MAAYPDPPPVIPLPESLAAQTALCKAPLVTVCLHWHGPRERPCLGWVTGIEKVLRREEFQVLIMNGVDRTESGAKTYVCMHLVHTGMHIIVNGVDRTESAETYIYIHICIQYICV